MDGSFDILYPSAFSINMTDYEIEQMQREFDDSRIVERVRHGELSHLDAEACYEYFEKLREKVGYTEIRSPSGLYRIPLFTEDPIASMELEMNLEIRTDDEAVKLLKKQGSVYASQEPNLLFIDPGRMSPQHRLGTYLVGSEAFMACSEEEG